MPPVCRRLVIYLTTIIVVVLVAKECFHMRRKRLAESDGGAGTRPLTAGNMSRKSIAARINGELVRGLNGHGTTDPGFRAQLANGTLSADDPRVLNFIRTRISKPSGKPINLADKMPGKTDFSIAGTSTFVDRLLGGKIGGFFIECGGADGETVSNSIFFELSRKWTGLLIELNPDFYAQILAKHRNAYALHACLSTKRSPSVMKVKPAGLSGGIAAEMSDVQLNVGFVRQTSNINVTCFPLNAIMDAIGVHDVDFMSLDVEGAEMAVLQTIDFTRLNIKVLVVEYVLQGVSSLPDKGAKVRMERLGEIRRIMAATGLYREVGTLPEGTSEKEGHDVVFQRV